jgi:hypothetical protein
VVDNAYASAAPLVGGLVDAETQPCRSTVQLVTFTSMSQRASVCPPGIARHITVPISKRWPA